MNVYVGGGGKVVGGAQSSRGGGTEHERRDGSVDHSEPRLHVPEDVVRQYFRVLGVRGDVDVTVHGERLPPATAVDLRGRDDRLPGMELGEAALFDEAAGRELRNQE